MPRAVVVDPARKRKKYPRQRLIDALEAVKCGRSVREVSIEYGVPKTTLMSKYKGTHPLDGRSGPQPVLDEKEEKELVEWLNEISEIGFTVKKNQLCGSVQTTLRELKRKNIFSDDKPGHNWYKNFEERHPEIVERFKKNLSYFKTAPSEASVREWFAKTKKYLESMKLFAIDPSRIFTCEEAALVFNPSGKKIVVRKGDRADFSFAHNHADECASTLFMANARGVLAPPVIVFKQERIRPSMMSKLPEFWSIGKTHDGWMTKESFQEYITKVFDKWLKTSNIEKPVVLFIDANSVFPTQSLTKLCKERNIHLLPIHPNMSHILQPLDSQFFEGLKDSWALATEHWRSSNNRKRIKKENFAGLLSTALKMVNQMETITKGFACTGIYPFTPDAVDYGKKGRFKMQVIMKPKDDEEAIERIVDPQYSTEEVKKHLEFLEDFIDDDKLRKFREEEGNEAWSGEIKDTSLFILWKKLRKMTSTGNNVECQIYTSTMDEAGASRGHFMSIDEAAFQPPQMMCQPMVTQSYAEMRGWMGANLEKLN